MSTGFQNELANFHQFVGQQLSNAPEISPEEALDKWRTEHPAGDDLAQSVAALREALADMAAGDEGMPFAEFDREFRAGETWMLAVETQDGPPIATRYDCRSTMLKESHMESSDQKKFSWWYILLDVVLWALYVLMLRYERWLQSILPAWTHLSIGCLVLGSALGGLSGRIKPIIIGAIIGATLGPIIVLILFSLAFIGG